MTTVLDRDQAWHEPQSPPVPADLLDRDQLPSDTRTRCVPADLSAGDQFPNVPQKESVAGTPSRGAAQRPTPIVEAHNPRAFAELRLLAESFEDAQKARIAIENRLRSGTDDAPVVLALESLRTAEHKLGLAMRRSFRKAAPSVSAWVKETQGVGEHLVARLLGTIGHPVIASPYHWEGEGPDRKLIADPPFLRSVSQLWSYCGHGDPTRKKRKGMSADEAMALGNPRAKMIVHLIAEGCIKCVGSAIDDPAANRDSPTDADLSGDQSGVELHRSIVPANCPGDGSTLGATPTGTPIRRRSPYRDVYDLGRITYADRVDAEGKPWTLAHQHNAALRLVGKAVLRDLWVVSQ